MTTPTSMADAPTELHAALSRAAGITRDAETLLAVATAITGTWPQALRSDGQALAKCVAFHSQDPLKVNINRELKRKGLEAGPDSGTEAVTTAKPLVPADAPRLILRSHAERLRDREKPPPMLVSGMLPVGGTGMLVALPGAGKTLTGIELARSVAAGDTFAGRAVIQGRVLYACPDSPASTERRMLAIPESTAARILTVCDLPAMPGSLPGLRDAITESNSVGDPIRLVIIDTWDSARFHSDGGWAGQDGLVEGIMAELRRMAADLSLAIVVIHHATRADNGRARGSVVMDARQDFIGLVEGDGSMVRLTAIKCRDGERGPIGSWRVLPVEVAGAMVPTLVPADIARPVGQAAHDDDTRVLCFLAINAGQEGMSLPRIAKHLGHRGNGQAAAIVARLRQAGLVEAGNYSLTPDGQTRVDLNLAFHDPLPCTPPMEGPMEGFHDPSIPSLRVGKNLPAIMEAPMEAGQPSTPSTHIGCGMDGSPSPATDRRVMRI